MKLARDGSQKAERNKVSQPAVAAEVLWQFLEEVDREHFVVVLLDTQNQIIGLHTPSGDLTPSAEDRSVTRLLVDAGVRPRRV